MKPKYYTSKDKLFKLPPIVPEKHKYSNFFVVCIKAIQNNKDGVINKKECIEGILELKKKAKTKSKFYRCISSRELNTFKATQNKFKSKIINKRRTLSQILAEYENKEINEKNKNEKENENSTNFKVKLVENSTIKNEAINNPPNQIEKDKEKIIESSDKNSKEIENNKNFTEEKEKESKKTQEKKELNKNENNENPSKAQNEDEKEKKKEPEQISKRYAVFKKIISFLKDNDLTINDLIEKDPIQHKPFEIISGDEFIEAVKFRNYNFVEEALKKSFRFLFVFDYFGQTAYHWAAKLGDLRMLKLLLNYGGHINQKDFKGRTPLYLAAVNNNKEMCDFLISKKAKVYIKDNNGLSPADVAGSSELKYNLNEELTRPIMSDEYKDYKEKIDHLLGKRNAKIQKRKEEIIAKFLKSQS